VDEPPRTRLEQIVQGSKRTAEEHTKDFEKTARRHDEKSASLSLRHFRRWMEGGVKKARQPNMRVAEMHWGEPFEVLVGPPSTAAPARPEVELPATQAADRIILPSGLLDHAELDRNPERVEQLTAVLLGQRQVEHGVVRHLAGILAETRHLDDLLGAGDLVDPVNSQRRLVVSLLGTARDESVRRALWILAAELSQFLAWLLLDLAQYDKAESCYRNGLRAAKEADDADLSSYMLGWLSFVACYQGQPEQAVGLARMARAHGAKSKSGTHRAWLAAIEGRAQAFAQHPDAALQALDEAEDEIGASPAAENPSWLYHFGSVALAGYRGTSLVLMGHSEAGITTIEETLPQLAPSFVRARAIYDTLLMGAALELGDDAGARRYGTRALETATATSSRRAVQAVREIRRRVPAGAVHADWQGLDEQLMLV
jgi:tetratricopeptide (TPR) repeat protein